jgi:hypothetical protein
MPLKTDLEFELFDIFEPYGENYVKANIEYILMREKLWQKGMSIVFPQGALNEYREESKHESGFYQRDFEVFAADQNTILYYGTAYGSILAEEIIDMTVELHVNFHASNAKTKMPIQVVA